jgi:phage gp37-like protein
MTFRDIQSEIISALRTEIPYLRTVESYAGQLESDLEGTTVRYPAAYVIYGGSEFAHLDGTAHEESVTFTVVAAVRDVRGSSSAISGAQGAYALLLDIIAALTNETFDLDIERMRPVRTALLHTGGATTVYGVDFSTRFDTNYE